MIKKIIFVGLLLISLGINAFLISKFVGGSTQKIEGDERVSIVMSNDNREFVMREMRHFVESVQQINAGILYERPELIIEAARKSGHAVTECAPQGLVQTLPLSFKQLGFSTHDLFDEIADEAEKNFSPKRTQEQLNQLLTNCVSCHRGFRIDAQK
ncbi:hypothetical protein [Capnocytophaga felis]|uniref:Cytochrome c n=1 Tax=Capnocytophaga felis TaxID=2267611 RepID=A0A5M4BCK3_9FLAO|nr:hypothetical protein [Capnocytophaga felis]GET47092.1 hypothetical protein RCZ01_23940 [Capnocytophaga felis]GET49605.1 hypothetical protein RCZ02_24360 [Capnocytophaga felis]